MIWGYHYFRKHPYWAPLWIRCCCFFFNAGTTIFILLYIYILILDLTKPTGIVFVFFLEWLKWNCSYWDLFELCFVFVFFGGLNYFLRGPILQRESLVWVKYSSESPHFVRSYEAFSYHCHGMIHPERLTAGTWEYTPLKRKIIFPVPSFSGSSC